MIPARNRTRSPIAKRSDWELQIRRPESGFQSARFDGAVAPAVKVMNEPAFVFVALLASVRSIVHRARSKKNATVPADVQDAERRNT